MTRELILGALVALLIVAAEALSLLFVIPAHGAECAGKMVLASWFGAESGSKTATGGHFDGSQWLVAHKTLPFGTKLRLTYRGRSVVVPIGDRGPYIKGRTLDLSHAVALALGTIPAGIAKVCMERL